MTTFLVAFGCAFLVSVVLTRVVRDLALAQGLLDSPDGHRRVHDRPIPRLGGIAIAAGFTLPMLGLAFVRNDISAQVYERPERLVGLLIGAAMMVGLGIVDDVKGLGAKPKFTVQTLAALVAWSAGFAVEQVANPFGAPIELGILALPVTLLWIVGITNAMNLIDGLDGLAGGVAFVACLLLFVLGVADGRVLLALLAASLGGAILGFLRYNFHPATIFMGDCGSLFLGYVLAVTGIWSSSKSPTLVALAIPILALGVPIADTGMAMFRRFVRGKPMFSADREHLHHRLLDLGLTKRQAVLVIYAACALLAFSALCMVYASGKQAAVILGAVTIAALASGRAIGWLDPREIGTAWVYGRRRHSTAMGRVEAARIAAERIRAAQHVDDAIDVLIAMAPALHVQTVAITLELGGQRWECSWGTGSAQTRRSYPLDWRLGQVECTGTLEWGWEAAEPILHIPEEPCLHLLALVLRDRALELRAREDRVTPLREARAAG